MGLHVLILTVGICGENCKYMYIANIDKAHLTAFLFLQCKINAAGK